MRRSTSKLCWVRPAKHWPPQKRISASVGDASCFPQRISPSRSTVIPSWRAPRHPDDTNDCPSLAVGGSSSQRYLPGKIHSLFDSRRPESVPHVRNSFWNLSRQARSNPLSLEQQNEHSSTDQREHNAVVQIVAGRAGTAT